MNAYVIVQRAETEELLQNAFPKELFNGVQFVVTSGPSDAVSMARSLIVRRRTPLAYIMDADTTALRLIREQRQSIEEVIGMVAAHVPFKVILAVPTLAEELASASQPSEAPAVRELAEFLRQAAAAPALSLAGSA